MPDTDELYDKAGELTQDCLNQIIEGDYSFFDDEDELTEEYLLTYRFKTFADGLNETIASRGFSGDITSADEKIVFIRNKCTENGVPLNPSVVRAWFADTRPISSEKSRENVYRFCFAMKMDITETAGFFLKVYYECPFNYRIIDEAVYFFCLNNGKSYSYAQSLKEKAESIIKECERHDTKYEFTSAIGTGLKNIRSEERFLEFVSENSSEFHIGNRTAYKYAAHLIEECCELARKECESRDEITQKTGRETNIDLLIYVIFGENINQYKKNSSFAKTAGFPELVKANFPLKMNLSKIRNGEKVSYDTMRKALVLLNFYRYFAELFQENKYSDFCVLEEDLRGFAAETNDLLASCGYPVLYVRNPFDWLIMHCACNEYPLEEFRNAVKRYYLDMI